MGVFVARSFDGGLSWPDVELVARGLGGDVYQPDWNSASVAVQDFDWLARGPGDVLLLTWWEARGATSLGVEVLFVEVRFAVSSDRGATWTTPAVLAEGSQYPVAAVGADGTFYVAYKAGRTAVHLARSEDRGESWDVSVVAEDVENPSYSIAVDGQHVLAAVESFSAEPAPRLLRSSDRGATWSEPVRLEAPNEEDPTLATVAFDGRGVPYVSLYRSGPQDADDLSVLRIEPDGTFIERNANRAPFRSSGDGSYQRDFRREYMGLAGLPEGVFAVWVGGDAPMTQIRGSRID